MAFHNVPPNGFPDIPDIEDLEAVQGDITALKTGKTPKTDIAAEFSATTNYAVGDLVYKDGVLYECTTAHEASAWAAGDFTAASVGSVASSLMSGLTNVDVALSVPENSGKNLYSIKIGADTYTANSGGSAVNNDGVLEVSCLSSSNYSGVYSAPTSVLSKTIEGLTGVYTYSCYMKSDVAGSCIFGFNDLGLKNVDLTTEYQRVSTTATLSAQNKSLVFYGGGIERTIYVKDFQIEKGSTATSYAPYIPSVESRIEAVESGLVKITKESFEQITVNAGSKKFVTNVGLLTDNVVVTAYSDNSDVIAYVATATTTYQVYLYNPTNAAITSNITVMVAKV